jgi:hypothetical protein
MKGYCEMAKEVGPFYYFLQYNNDAAKRSRPDLSFDAQVMRLQGLWLGMVEKAKEPYV